MTRLQRRQLRKRKYKLLNDKSINYENIMGYDHKMFESQTGEYTSRWYNQVQGGTRSEFIKMREKEVLSREVTSTPLYEWQ